MIRRIGYNLLLFFLLFALGIFFYRNIFDGQAGFLVACTVFFTVYGAAMTAGAYGMQKLLGYEQYAIYHTIEENDRKRIFLYAMLSLCPMDICMLLVSFMPLPAWEFRVVTLFPCLLLVFMPIKEVYDTQYPLAHYRTRFWIVRIFIASLLYAAGQNIVGCFL